MTDAEEIQALEKIKRCLKKEIHPDHGIEEMDVDCPECRAAIHIAAINARLNLLRWLKKS